MQPSVPNGLLRSDLDGKGLLPQVTQASHSELSEDDQYRGGQGGRCHERLCVSPGDDKLPCVA